MESTHQNFVEISNPYLPNIKTTLTTVSGVPITGGMVYYPTLAAYRNPPLDKMAKKALDRMARQAERDDKRGRTQKFPAKED